MEESSAQSVAPTKAVAFVQRDDSYLIDCVPLLSVESCHRIVKKDVFLIEANQDFEAIERVVESILSRCSDLLAFYCWYESYRCHYWESMKWAKCLHKFCPKTEHLFMDAKYAIRDIFGINSLLNIVREDKPLALKCFWTQNWGESEGLLVRFIELCPQLSSFHYKDVYSLYSESMTGHTVAALPPGLKELSIKCQTISEQMLQRIAEKVELERLLLLPSKPRTELGVNRVNHLCNRLTKLKAVSFFSDPREMVHLEALTKLEEIEWRSKPGLYDDQVFSHLLSKRGIGLRILRLFSCDLEESAFSSLSTKCPNLVELRVECSRNQVEQDMILSNLFPTYLNGLQKLRRLHFPGTRETSDGLIHVLGHWTKLRSLGLLPVSTISKQLLGALVSYAKVHSSRHPIEVIVAKCSVKKEQKLVELMASFQFPSNLAIVYR